jgi:hypothetical protein
MSPVRWLYPAARLSLSISSSAVGKSFGFRGEGTGFRFVDAEQVEALRLALVGLAERATRSG